MKVLTSSIAVLLVTGVSGCINPEAYETPPVYVSTPSGNVECHLYTTEHVFLDRAINMPSGMSIVEADQICKSEGARRQAM